MPINLLSVGGGITTITTASSASNFTVTIPAATGSVITTAPGANGNVLTSNGSAWVSSTPAAAAGVAKAWAQYTPSSGSIAGSKNVSSVSSGIPWTVNWASAFPNANYAVVVGNGNASGDSFARAAFISAINTGSVSFNTPQNYPLVQCVAAFND